MRSLCVTLMDDLEHFTFWSSPATAINRAMRMQRRKDLDRLLEGCPSALPIVVRTYGWVFSSPR